MTRSRLIEEIIRLQGRDANPDWLNTRTTEQLREIYKRWSAITSTTDAEISRHCNTDFLNPKNS